MERTSSHLDTVYRLLADRRRRLIVGLLGTDDRRLTLNDLAKEIAVRERDAPITELSGEELTRIYLSLQHVHVPKLAEAGYVEYDERRSTVAAADELDRLRAIRRVVEPVLAEESRPDDRTVA